MNHVLANPASPAQRAKAQEFLDPSERDAAAAADKASDPDAVTDKHGNLPPARR